MAQKGYSSSMTTTTTITTTTTSPSSSPSPQTLRKKLPASITTAAPQPVNGLSHSKLLEKETMQQQRREKQQLPDNNTAKWLIRLFLLGVWFFPAPSVLAGEPIPLMFKVLYAVATLYTVVYFGLRVFIKNELTVKRLMSGCFSLALGGLPAYVLYFEPEFQNTTHMEGLRTVNSDTAQGILLGFYLGDMWWITPSQLNIPSLLVHHVSVVSFWVFSYYQPITMTVTMMAQMQEICNPFWYFHWIFFSSYLYKNPKWRGLFFVNAALIMAGYVGLRLLWVQLRLTQYVWWMVWNYPPSAAFMVPTGIAIETVINAMNIYKLGKSIRTAWNTPVDYKQS